jgi:hypothetical protein
MHCPKCSCRNLTSIRIRLAPEEERMFASCHGCEWKGWFKEDDAVPLQDVLSLAAQRRF